MIILALDTTTAAGSQALWRDGRVVDARIGDPARSHGQRLPGELQHLLESHGLGWKDVDLYAVAIGPGSFTGLRVGIATIQGLALVHDKQVVGVSALDGWAQGALDVSRDQPEGALIGVALEAQRGEVFAALYELGHTVDGNAGVVLREEPFVIKREELFTSDWEAHLRTRPLFVISDLPSSTWSMAGTDNLRRLEPVTNLASHIAVLAADRAHSGSAVAPHAVQPLYVRRPDVELARERQTPAPASERSNHG